jgi:expansin (peptidoglycan-binding protein)
LEDRWPWLVSSLALLIKRAFTHLSVLCRPLATYYYQNGNAGACGVYHSDSDKIIAINGAGYWSNYESGGVSPYCGKWITIKATDGSGRSTQAMVADVCPTCMGSTNSLDLSVAAFEDLGTLSQGQIDIEWSFNN